MDQQNMMAEVERMAGGSVALYGVAKGKRTWRLFESIASLRATCIKAGVDTKEWGKVYRCKPGESVTIQLDAVTA